MSGDGFLEGFKNLFRGNKTGVKPVSQTPAETEDNRPGWLRERQAADLENSLQFSLKQKPAENTQTAAGQTVKPPKSDFEARVAADTQRSELFSLRQSIKDAQNTTDEQNKS